jgi:hypothetical protein
MKSLIFTLPLFLTLASARNIHIRQTADNLQTFTGTLGASADAITFSGDTTRPFLVNGNTFVNFAAAAQRTCDIQFNACADAANSGAAFSVNDCQTQEGMFGKPLYKRERGVMKDVANIWNDRCMRRSSVLCDCDDLR